MTWVMSRQVLEPWPRLFASLQVRVTREHLARPEKKGNLYWLPLRRSRPDLLQRFPSGHHF